MQVSYSASFTIARQSVSPEEQAAEAWARLALWQRMLLTGAFRKRKWIASRTFDIDRYVANVGKKLATAARKQEEAMIRNLYGL